MVIFVIAVHGFILMVRPPIYYVVLTLVQTRQILC